MIQPVDGEKNAESGSPALGCSLVLRRLFRHVIYPTESIERRGRWGVAEQSSELLQALRPLARLPVEVRVSSVVMSTISIRSPEETLDTNIRLI